MKLRKILAALISMIMVISSMSIQAFANDGVNGIPENSWSTAALNAAVANGLLVGDSTGHVQPKKNITRAEATAVINRAFGATQGTPIAGDAWYAADMGKGVHMGIIDADDLRPDASATREEVFSMLSRALQLTATSGGSTSALNAFGDGSSVSSDKQAEIAAMVSAGYVKGSANAATGTTSLSPKSNITREEFAQIMYSTIQSYASDTSISSVAGGNVMIRNAGTTVSGANVSGDLIIGDGVGSGDITIKDTKITGRLLVRGGGRNTVNVENSEIGGTLVVAKPDGNVRVRTTGSRVGGSEVIQGASTVAFNGSFGTINVENNVPFILEGGDADTINARGNSSAVTVAGDSTVGNVNLMGNHTHLNAEGGTVENTTTSGESTRVNVGEGASVGTINANGDNTVIYGNGEVGKVNVNASNSGVYTGNTEVAIGSGVTNTTVGENKVNAGESVTTDKPVDPGSTVVADTPDKPDTTDDNTTSSGGGLVPGPNTGGGGGGGGGSSPSTVSVTNINIISPTEFTFVAHTDISGIKVGDTAISLSGDNAPYAEKASGTGSVVWTVYLGERNELTATPKTLEVTRSGYSAYTNTSALKFVPVTGVTVAPSTVSLMMGGTDTTLTASVQPSGATLRNIVWDSSDTSVATVNPSGRVTPVGVGTATITATTPEGVFGSATVTVTPFIPTPVAVTRVTLNKSTLAMEIGDTETLTATIAPANATNKAVTWSSSDATVATVDANGLVSAVSAGTATITVTTVDGSHTANCDVTVTAAPGVYTMNTPAAIDQNNIEASVTYNPSAASAGTTVTATVTLDGQADEAGEHSINLTSVQAGLSGTAQTLDVEEDEIVDTIITFTFTMPSANVTDLTLTHTFIAEPAGDNILDYVDLGAKTEISASPVKGAPSSSVTPPAIAAGTGYTVSGAWESGMSGDDFGVGMAGYVITLTPSAGYTFDETDIEATSFASDFTVGSPGITIVPYAISAPSLKIMLNYATVNAPVDKSLLEAAITAANANKASVTVSVDGTDVPSTDQWVTANDFALYTDFISLAQAIFDDPTSTQDVIDDAVSDLTNIGSDFDSRKQYGTQPIPVAGISLNETTLSLEPGDTSQLTATITPANATNQGVTWTTTNSSFAGISQDGEVTAFAAGSATITATSDADNSITATCVVTVTTPAVTDLDLTALIAAPVKGQMPNFVTPQIDATQYTGSISWSPIVAPVIGSFQPGTVYTATVSLTAKPGFSFTGVAANAFTYTGATSVTNAADSGTVTIVFPATATTELSVTGLSATDKTYDGTADATITGTATLGFGVQPGDTVSLDTTAVAGTFADKNVGTGKTVTVTGLTLTGADASKYTLADVSVTANITAVGLTVTGASAENRVYASGNTSVTVSGGSLTGVITPDAVTLDDSGATGTMVDDSIAAGKTVTVSGYAITGTDAGNYTLTQPTGVTVDITAPTFTVTYNGNGADGGTAPTDANSYTSGQQVTVAGLGTLTKTGTPLWSGAQPLTAAERTIP